MRQAIEGVFTAVSRGGSSRRSGVFATLCATFGLGAAVGAFATKQIPNLALGIPVIALLLVLLRCESPGDEASP